MASTPQHPDRAHHLPDGHHDDHSAHAAMSRSPQHAEHDRHEGHSAEMFRRLFLVNLAIAVPVLAFSDQIQQWFGYSANATATTWVPPILGSVIYLWGGKPFLVGARNEAQARQPGMMMLIALAITVAYLSSLATAVGLLELDFWWELAALIVVMLLGHWQEMKAVGQARGALSALAELLPDIAEVVSETGEVSKVATNQLRLGDVVLVRPGGRVPADGTIVEGSASLDESMITGESRPVRRAVGQDVVAGTVSTDAAIRVQVSAVGEDTALAGIQRLIADAEAAKSGTQALADRAAAILFYVAVGAGLITLAAWSAVGDPSEGIIRAVTVLVIACPHALGLAIPLVIANSTAVSAKAGILVKDRLALEKMRGVDTVLFDKTGTLTVGNHEVVETYTIDGWSSQDMVALAAAVEADSEHPVARAIRNAASDLEVPQAEEVQFVAGVGVRGRVDTSQVGVGGPGIIGDHAVEDPQLDATVDRWTKRGGSVLYVLVDNQVIGAMTLEDEIRAVSKEAVDRLHRHDVQVVLITGDAHQVAEAVATELNIDETFSEVLPHEKDSKVAELQSRGRVVAMVGDGVNDAPALARADVGIAIGAGTDVAMESAGIVLASNDPRAVVSVIDLSVASYRKMVQNLVWATAYNALAIPVAAGAFAFAGISLAPALAAVFMSASTIIVAANAQTLRRLDLRPDRDGQFARPQHQTAEVPVGTTTAT